MISPLLDPNQIPLVRASERRSAEAPPRSFDQAINLPAPEPEVDSPVIEVEMQDARGTARRIALPWGLAANGRLSQQGTGILADTQLFLRTQPTVAPLEGAVTMSVTAMAPGAYPTSMTPRLPNLSAPLPVLLPRNHVEERLQESSMSPAKAPAESGVPWQERWLQWLRSSNGDLQVRLRDYRLNDVEQRQLLEQMHVFARDQGLTLTRLTVNGRELWRTPVQESGETHGG